MRPSVNRLPLDRLLKQIFRSRRIHYPIPARVDFLPEPPLAPRYPCPFLTATDMPTYVLPLYRFGWGISRVPNNTSATKPALAATQLSKRFTLPNPDKAKKFVEEITNTIIEPENHHPIFKQHSQGVLSIVDVHVHTHTARAPPDGQFINVQEFIRKRPGITHRDIRFAILVERFLLDSGLINSLPSVFYSQPTDIDSVHNFRALQEVRDSAEK